MKPSICADLRRQTAFFINVTMIVAIALGFVAGNQPTLAQSQASSASRAVVTAPSSLGDWTQFLRDNMERWNPYETVLGIGNAGNLQLKWTQSNTSPSAYYSDPVAVNGVVYVGSGGDSHLYAIDAITGQPLWSFFTAGFTVQGTPAVANGVIYFGAVTQTGCNSADNIPCGAVFAVNASSGAELWRFTSKDTPVTDITVANGVVCFGMAQNLPQGSVNALDASTGAVLWSLNTFFPSTPSMADGAVYFGNGGSVTAVALSGGVLWNFVIEATSNTVVFGAPVVANGMVYFGATNGNVYAVNANSGKTIWVHATGGEVGATPAVANGVVYVGSADGNLYALNATTGAKLWSFANGVSASAAVANGVVYNSSSPSHGNYQVYALNATTGAELWSFAISPVLGSPIVTNGNIYITGTRGGASHLYAFSVGADLFLRIQPSATTVHQGDLLTYAFPVWNLGPESAVHEVLNTQVPAGTTFDYVRISGTPGLGTCTTPPYQGTGQIVCHENAAMAPNTTWTVRLTVKVTAPSGTVITENAATMADTFDPNLANNMASVSIKVQ
jgi:outer membrane protein assembly factor BamB